MFSGAFQEIGESGEGKRCCFEAWRKVRWGRGRLVGGRGDEKKIEK
jgi:hypothetical protein